MTQAREGKTRTRKTRTLRKAIVALVAVILVVTAMVWLYYAGREPPPSNLDKVLLKTVKGDIVIELFDDMPITSGNFKNLVLREVYDGTNFTRVARNPAVIQGGDAGAKGITIANISDELPNKHSNARGFVAMAKTSEPNSATSQFYINLQDNLYLDSNYSVFGRVIEGMDVVDAIGSTPTNVSTEIPLDTMMIFEAELIAP